MKDKNNVWVKKLKIIYRDFKINRYSLLRNKLKKL